MYLGFLEPILLVLGLVIFLLSLGLYTRRTRDLKSVLIFWQARMQLNHREFILNRVGITIMFMGLMLRFANHFLVQ